MPARRSAYPASQGNGKGGLPATLDIFSNPGNGLCWAHPVEIRVASLSATLGDHRIRRARAVFAQTGWKVLQIFNPGPAQSPWRPTTPVVLLNLQKSKQTANPISRSKQSLRKPPRSCPRKWGSTSNVARRGLLLGRALPLGCEHKGPNPQTSPKKPRGVVLEGHSAVPVENGTFSAAGSRQLP